MKRFARFQKVGRIRHPFRRKAILEGLLVFTRYPEPGKTKTRLIRSLGPQGAADLHRRMTEHAVARLRRLKKSRPVFIEVWHDGGEETHMRRWLEPDLSYRPQIEGDLGERMALALNEAFRRGADRVVLVGADCPDITGSVVSEAFGALRRSDLVVGPARDGGYYLLGLREMIPELFVSMPWGTDKVLERTREAAERLGLSVHLLKSLADVDRPEDLPVWEKASRRELPSSPSPRISIIIPTLNEAGDIAGTIASAEIGQGAEVIVVDGGSTDGTVEIAQSSGAKIMRVSPGRAGQMNAGATAATGETLLFLHGDTRLPRGFDRYVHQTLSEPGTLAGAFELRIEGDLLGLRFIERVTNWRSRLFGLPYGDQAIFLGAGLFRYMGGFREMPIMEDFEFMRRLRRQGRVAIVPKPVRTSRRRWEKIGLLQATVINYLIPIAYYLGVPPSHLAHWYRQRRRIT